MRVLHVLQYSLPTTMGYAIRADGLLRASLHHGCEVAAVTGAALPGERPEREEINGIQYFRTPPLLVKLPPAVREAWLSRALKTRTLAVAREFRPGIIHVHSPAYNGLAALAVARRLRVPVVYEMRALWEDAAADRRGLGPRSVMLRLARAIETRVLRRAGAVITICEGLRREVISRGVPADKVFVVPNGVHTGQFEPSPPDADLANSLGLRTGPVFGFIGSLFNFEGVEDLLDAAPLVLARCPDANFLIVGGGERSEQVAARVRALASRNITYVPAVPHSEVRRYYSVIDCLVYPRRSLRLTELVTPLKPLEAMALGKAVVATDIGGHRELIDNGVTGILYEAGSRAALANALVAMASNAGLRARLGEYARQHVLAHRDWKSVVQPQFEAYRAVLGLRSGATRAAIGGGE
ncbi:MAG: glycosyltransferase [bacterium]